MANSLTGNVRKIFLRKKHQDVSMNIIIYFFGFMKQTYSSVCGVSFITQNYLFGSCLWWKNSDSVNSYNIFFLHTFKTIPTLIMKYYWSALPVRFHCCQQHSYALLEIVSYQHKVSEHLLNSISTERRGKTQQHKYCFVLKITWIKLLWLIFFFSSL